MGTQPVSEPGAGVGTRSQEAWDTGSVTVWQRSETGGRSCVDGEGGESLAERGGEEMRAHESAWAAIANITGQWPEQ